MKVFSFPSNICHQYPPVKQRWRAHKQGFTSLEKHSGSILADNLPSQQLYFCLVLKYSFRTALHLLPHLSQRGKWLHTGRKLQDLRSRAAAHWPGGFSSLVIPRFLQRSKVEQDQMWDVVITAFFCKENSLTVLYHRQQLPTLNSVMLSRLQTV